MKTRVGGVVLLFGLVVAVGCSGEGADTGKKGSQKTGHEGHDHKHGAHDAGHIVVIVKDKIQAKWFHDNKTGLITFYLIDGNEKELRTSAQHISITTTVKGKKPRDYKLPAMNSEGTPPKANKFEVTDKVLLEALKFAGDAVDVKLKVTVDGKDYQAKVTH